MDPDDDGSSLLFPEQPCIQTDENDCLGRSEFDSGTRIREPDRPPVITGGPVCSLMPHSTVGLALLQG